MSSIKHDDYVSELKERISYNYDTVSTHVPFSISRKSEGEIDIVAEKDKELDLYEVKCSRRITKAKKQLKRARKLLGRKGRSYFYCGNSGALIPLTE
ncbi:MAG: hypothetical protein ACQEP1_04360 [Nanobdellota archaeon]